MQELLISVGAVLSGASALIITIVTIRAWLNGHAAYDANRRVTYRSMLRTFKGEMRSFDADSDGRLSHGMSINLSTGKLRPQHRLSAEAIDDVIGRRV
jgi:hypothetical protein